MNSALFCCSSQRLSYFMFHPLSCTESLGMQRLNTIVSGLVLRRTKEEMGPELLKLTKRVVETHQVQLKPAEQQVYDALFFEARYSLCYLPCPQARHLSTSTAHLPSCLLFLTPGKCLLTGYVSTTISSPLQTPPVLPQNPPFRLILQEWWTL